MIFGELIAVGLDLDEVLVSSTAMYTVARRVCSLAALLNSTGYGMAVTVI